MDDTVTSKSWKYILLYHIIYMMLFYFIIPVFSRNQDDNKYIITSMIIR